MNEFLRLKYLTKVYRKLYFIAKVQKLRGKEFCVIASNCAGVLPYRFLRRHYNTPTVGLFFFAPDFIRFVKNLHYYLQLDLTFISDSKYEKVEKIQQLHGKYPIGLLNDIEIHFLHYVDNEEAYNKWNRRKKRVNYKNIVIAFTDADECTPDILSEFDTLAFERKYVLTANHNPKIGSSIHVPIYEGKECIGDIWTNYENLAYIDFIQRY